MTEGFDPYNELGVPRDADGAAIARAYKERAKKTHPNGVRVTQSFVGEEDAESWERTALAHAILSDPERRRRYDFTGKIEDNPDEQRRMAALTLIEQYIGGEVDKFFQTGKDDPRHRPLFKEFIARTMVEITTQQGEIAKGRGMIEYVNDLGSRLSTTEVTRPIESRVEQRAMAIEAQIIAAEDAIAVRRRAIELAQTYRIDTTPERDRVHPVFAEQKP